MGFFCEFALAQLSAPVTVAVERNRHLYPLSVACGMIQAWPKQSRAHDAVDRTLTTQTTIDLGSQVTGSLSSVKNAASLERRSPRLTVSLALVVLVSHTGLARGRLRRRVR